MADEQLTDEQVENWRRILCGMLGPYALIAPRGQIQAFRDKMQNAANESREVKVLSQEFVGQTVSEGTMRDEDLIPVFLDFLESAAPDYEGLLELGRRYGSLLIVRDAYGTHFDEASLDEARYLCEDLFNALDVIAPEGCYFGAHEGDGACYGFWRIEEPDEDLADPNIFTDEEPEEED